MRNGECLREAELLEALQASQWPDYCQGELLEHVSRCASCQALVDVATALLDEHDRGLAQAAVPSSGIVWWRAQMRARQEAARTATRPITVVQGLSLACAAGLLAGIAGLVSPEFRSWISWALDAAAGLQLPALPQSAAFMTSPAGFFSAIGAMLLVVLPVALYLTLSE